MTQQETWVFEITKHNFSVLEISRLFLGQQEEYQDIKRKNIQGAQKIHTVNQKNTYKVSQKFFSAKNAYVGGFQKLAMRVP